MGRIEEYAVKAFRELDGRSIYILCVLEFNEWITIVNTLIDCEFILIPAKPEEITKDKMWNYIITKNEKEKFIKLFTDNYEKVFKVFKSRF